jgi:hypothetical protein
MRDERTCSISHDEARRVEARVLALLIAEDWPWREHELAQRAEAPAAVVRACVARLRADGLATTDERGRARASRAALRANELAQHAAP